MLQWFLRFSEFTEFIESSTVFRENLISSTEEHYQIKEAD